MFRFILAGFFIFGKDKLIFMDYPIRNFADKLTAARFAKNGVCLFGTRAPRISKTSYLRRVLFYFNRKIAEGLFFSREKNKKRSGPRWIRSYGDFSALGRGHLHASSSAVGW
ncbi:MAG: hypothetical protein AAB731_00495 [Patescibacteria group bacterium]